MCDVMLAMSIFYIQGLITISDLKKCLSQNIEGYAAMASKHPDKQTRAQKHDLSLSMSSSSVNNSRAFRGK